MADDRLRDLERRFRASRSVEAEAAWLAERLRVGELTEEKLRLASFCNHPAAHEVVGSVGHTFEHPPHGSWISYWTMTRQGIAKGLASASRPEEPGSGTRDRYTSQRRRERAQAHKERATRVLKLLDSARPEPSWLDLRVWMAELSVWGREAVVRAVVAAARASTWPGSLVECLGAVEGWVLQPSPEKTLALSQAAAELEPRVESNFDAHVLRRVVDLALGSERAETLVQDAPSVVDDLSVVAGSGAGTLVPGVGSSGSTLDGFPGAAWLLGEWWVQTAIWREMIPWALGYHDPVRERAEAGERDST